MNWRVTFSWCAVSNEASSATCSSIIAGTATSLEGVAEEGLDVIARSILLLGLLLRHNHAHHVGLDGVVMMA
jgi:hypothetical protein